MPLAYDIKKGLPVDSLKNENAEIILIFFITSPWHNIVTLLPWTVFHIDNT
jgi:hypothetical protein